MSSFLSTANLNQFTVARDAGYTRHGFVKMFRRHAERRENYGFVTTELESGQLDVHVHIEGLYEWAYNGGDVPVLIKSDRTPNKGAEVFMTEPIETRRGSRSEKWIVSSVASFERVVKQITERPVYRVWFNGENVFESQNLNELLQRFPVDGRHVAYPPDEMKFDRREWNSLDWYAVPDPRIPDAELTLPSEIGFTHPVEVSYAD